MISNHIHIDKHGLGRKEALAEAEKVAAYCGLDRKDSLRLRLLVEELTGMLQWVAGEYSADFFIEEEDGLFQLCLRANAQMVPHAKERLVAVASSGRNEATRGVMGKIAALFEGYVLGGPEAAAHLPPDYLMMGMNDMCMPAPWSMQAYRNEVAASREARAQEWDELEKSIVANLADEVTVGVRFSRVEIRVMKRF